MHYLFKFNLLFDRYLVLYLYHNIYAMRRSHHLCWAPRGSNLNSRMNTDKFARAGMRGQSMLREWRCTDSGRCGTRSAPTMWRTACPSTLVQRQQTAAA
jgi:hypothetical protein